MMETHYRHSASGFLLSAICGKNNPPEAISDGRLNPATDTNLLLAAYRGGSHLTSDVFFHASFYTATGICLICGPVT